MSERHTAEQRARPAEEEELRALRWLVDQRANGGPLERHFAATVIETLAWFEPLVAEVERLIRDRDEQENVAIKAMYRADRLAAEVERVTRERDEALRIGRDYNAQALAQREQNQQLRDLLTEWLSADPYRSDWIDFEQRVRDALGDGEQR